MNVNYNSLSNGRDTNLKRTWLKTLAFMLFFAMCGTFSANAQFSVTTNGGSGLAGTYSSLQAAITALNGATITSPVIITCPTGTETAPAGGYSITATGTSANTITIQGNGAGSSIVTAPAQASGSLTDAIFKIIGGDYITINGFAMNENAANTTTAAATNNMTEFGVALFYATATNGAQNCTISGNAITLNRTYQNTFGIYSNSTHTATAVTISASATGTAGGNSGMKVYGNTITNVNQGIVVVGPTAVADANTGIDIGGTGGVQANSITNWGTTGTFSGYVNVSGSVSGILVRNSNGFNISYNTITSSNGGTTSGTLNGIQVPAASSTPTATFTNTINNNNISLRSGLIAGAINGINFPSGSASATSILNISNNDFNTFGHTVAGTGAIVFVLTSGTDFTKNINGNTFSNISVNTTGSVTFFSHGASMPVNGSQTFNANAIVTAFAKTGAGGTITGFTSGTSSVNGSTSTMTNNNFSNITVTGATAITGITNSDGAGTSPNRTVTGNTFNNWAGGTSAIIGMSFSYIGATSNISNNTITNISGQSTITAITIGSSFNGGNPLNVSNNTINSLSSTGAGGSVTALTCSNTSTVINISGNAINTLSTTGASAVVGIGVTGSTSTNVFRNKIYDLSGSNASSTVNGILVSSGTLATIYNNIIGDLRTPAANAANPLNGINITGGTASNVYYNTVRLAGASTGALFGSSAISVSTTPTVTLRNNIFVNISTTTGAGLAVAYRRSGTTLASYNSASNNNLFFATTNIYTDGTNTDASIGAFKTRVAPRDSASFSNNPTFLSTTGSNANFLHIDPAVSTQLESGGAAISGITDDFDGTTRSATTPDVGADEFTGSTPAPLLSGLTISPTGNLCTATSRHITVTATTPSGTITGVSLNYAFNGTAQTAIAMTNTSGNIWEGDIPAASPVNANVTWSVTATNSISITTSLTGTPYQDDPLFEKTPTASASINPVCSGSPTVLNAVFVGSGGSATVGSDTTTTGATEELTAFENRRSSYRMQSVFTAAELTAAGLAAGNITAIKYNISALGSSANNTNYIVKIGNTALSALTDYVSTASGFTTVFPAASYTSAVGVNTLTFSTPFAWNGVSNIIVEISHNGIDSINNAQTYYSTTTGNTTAYGFNGAATGTLSNKRFNTTFVGVAGLTPTSVSWSDGTDTVGTTNNLSVSPVATTTYTATLAYNGCSSTASVTVNVTALPAAPTTSDVSRCGTGPISLTASTSESGATIKWYAAATGGTALFTGSPYNIPSISSTTTYYVAAENGVCSSTRVAVVATVVSPPTFAISSDGSTPTSSVTICAGSTSGLFTALGNDYDTFTISPTTGVASSNLSGTFSASFNPSTTTAYTITAAQSSGALCSTSITFTVTVGTSNVTIASSASSICLGSSVNLSASSFTGGSANAPIGTATTLTSDTTQPTAFCNRWPSYRMQMVFTAAELQAAGLSAGSITSLAFNIATLGNAATNDITLKIGTTSLSTLTAAFELNTGYTTVYPTQTYTHTASGLQTIPFSTPFVWNGTSNIIVDMTQTGANLTNNSQTYYTATTGNTVAYTLTSATGTVSASANRLNVVFSGSNSVNVTNTYSYAWTSDPVGFTASTATTSATPTATTTYYVAATAPNGCVSNGSVTVTVNTDSIANITGGATSICLGSPTVPAFIDFDSTVGALWSSSNTAVATVDSNGVVTPLTVGTTTINARIENPTTGCITYAANPQTVSVYAPLAITSQPQSLSVLDYDGTNTTTNTFSVAASGSVTGYQWQVSPTGVEGSFSDLANSAPYSGVTTATLTITNATTAISGLYYRALVSGNSPCSSPIASDAALLTVSDVSITADPVFGAPICGSGDRNVTVGISGPSGTTVVWQYSDDSGASWNTIDGSAVGALTFTGNVESTTLELHNITSANNGWLLRAAAVSGDTVVFSNPTTIVVNQPAVISTSSPVQNVTICSTGGTAVFTVSATGATGYQWQYSNDGSTWNNVANGTPTGATYSNAATASLTVNGSSAIVAGPHYYRAMVSSQTPCPAQYSNVGELLINTPVVTISPVSAVICNPGGSPVTLTASGTASSYSWSPATGLSATSGASVTANPTVTTTYTVTGTETGGCTNTAQVTVTVGRSVAATATATPGTICEGTTVQLNAADTTSYAQTISGYSFATSTDSFQSIVGQSGATAVVLSSVDDAISSAITIPFTFTYGGLPFTTFKLNSNGWINLGATATSTTSYTVLTTENNTIAAFNRDLKGINTTSDSFFVQTVGTSPNRITKIEWTNIKGYDGVSPFNPRSGTFQIWLYEGSNKVEMHYGAFTTDSTVTNTTTVQVGLRGASSGVADIRSLSNTGNWSSPTVGTANASTVALGNFATPFLPSNGLVYSFTPSPTTTYTYAWTSSPAGFTSSIANPTVTPSENTNYSVVITNAAGCSGTANTTVTVQSGATITTQPAATTACQGSTAVLSVVANGPGLTYQWYNAAGPIAGATSATYSITNVALANAGNYFVIVTPTCGSAVTSDTVALTVNPTPTATAPSAQSFCAGTTTPIVLNGSPSGVTFDISGGASIGLANQTGVTAIPSFTATAGTATITITPKANGCTGTAVTFAITVNASPATPTLGSNTPVCQGGALNLTASTVTISGYSMNANSGVSFIDIDATGTSVGTLGDDTEHNITIPSFVLNGVTYTSARAGMNGAVLFGTATADVSLTNTVLPTTATGMTIFLAPFWDDLDIQTAASIKTQTVGNVHIIQYTTAAHNNFTTGSVTFQIQLNLITGAISYVYQDVIFGSATYDAGLTATVGLQLSSTSAIQYSFNSASLSNGQSITFTPNTAAYAWTGPNGFSSSLQNPTISNVTSAAAGVYSVTVTNPATGCSSVAATTTVAVTTPTTYYADSDGDTYGNLAVTASSCTGAPTGYVANSTDCNDGNANVYQSALLYIDADGDGYDAGQSTVCYGAAVPSGYSATTLGTDCNDADSTLTTNCTPSSSVVNIKMFIEGYYTGGGSMTSVALNQDYVSDAANVEVMTVELHDATTFGLVASATGMLHTDGTLSVSFSTAPSGSFYIAVKGSNILQTWTSDPQTVGAAPLAYDFTTSASQAYGDNMREIETGVFAVYSGDINQDEVTDNSDLDTLYPDIDNSNFGVLATDLNGDGVVDNSDLDNIFINIDNSRYSNHP